MKLDELNAFRYVGLLFEDSGISLKNSDPRDSFVSDRLRGGAMAPKFSDRIGITSRRNIQLEEMDDRLRNSLWNVLYQLIFDVEHMDYAEREEALEFLASEFFRIPMDEVPSR